MNRFVEVAREQGAKLYAKTAMFAVALSASPFAMAADGDIDVSDVLLKIGAGVTAGLLVSVAMTAGILGIKASKLPRRGG